MPAPTTLDDLYLSYHGKIRAFLSTATSLSPEDLEDAAQDVYLKFHKNGLLARYADDRAAFTSYLFLVCRSVAQNRHRAVTRRPQFQALEKRQPDGLPGRRLDDRLSQGPNQDWRVLLRELRVHLQRQPEIAELLARFEDAGQLPKVDHLRLQHALAPLLAAV